MALVYRLTTEINIDALAGELVGPPDPETMRQGMRDAAEYVLAVWGSAVQGNMLPGMSRPVQNDEYYKALSTGENIQLPSPWEAVVVALYAGVKRIEEGYPPFDIKPGLLAGPRVKRTKDGRPYQDVPFRHFTPGELPGGHRAHGASMPEEIYGAALRLAPGERLRGGEAEWWSLRSKVPALVSAEAKRRWEANQMTVAQVLRARMRTPYTWKSGMYAGMMRMGEVGHGHYYTFRRVSKASEDASWWHPGMPANPVVEAVARAAQPGVSNILVRYYAMAIGRPELADTAEMT